MPKVRPTLLLIMDGWGIAPEGPGNAPFVAKTPNLDRLWANYPHTELIASGRDVGLPKGYMGNSEVGHLNIGAGRIVYQDMTKIDLALENGELAKNPVLNDLFAKVKAAHGRMHFMGLLSDGGVHSHILHLIALCELATSLGLPVRIHCIMDGRDTDPKSGLGYVKQLEDAIKDLPDCKIVDCVGRFYAMDRDNRWERVESAWRLLVEGKAESTHPTACACLEDSYAADVTDEFVKPCLVSSNETPGLKEGDGIFLFNFRADRMRELTRALIDPSFDKFQCEVPRGKLAGIASMTAYEKTFDIPVAFPKDPVHLGLGELVSKMGLHQLRLAETEKYAHVTYFFNGGIEEPFANEKRIMIPSPKEVATYDLKPSMSAREVTETFLKEWASGEHDLVILNLANGDMVGHTGILPAAIEACEVVDECVGKMAEAVLARQGRMIIIADHGNCEVMKTPDGGPHTAHTTNPVPCILVDDSVKPVLKPGRLSDVAPTILGLWGFEVKEPMTGQKLAGDAADRVE